MELLIIILVVAVIGGLVMYRLTNASSNALKVLDVADVNKDGVINKEDAKEVVAAVTETVKKATTKKSSTKRPASKAKAKL
jgi:uncharacterized cupin superfamily protein